MKNFKNYTEFVGESIILEAEARDYDFKKAETPKGEDLKKFKDSGKTKEQWEILKSTFKNPHTNKTISIESAIKLKDKKNQSKEEAQVYDIAKKLLKKKFRIDYEKPADKKEVKAQPKKEEPKKSEPKKEEPKSETKDKTLKKGDPTKTELFKKDESFTDKEFNEKNKDIINPSSIKKFQFKKNKGLENPKFPKKYVKVIERMMNTNRSHTSKMGWTNFSKDKGGAGDISAQGGEILALMGSGMDDKDATDFYNQLREHAKEVKAKGLKATIDDSWINAAEKQRKAITARIAKQYPKGSKIIATSWDTPDEVSTLGLSDYAKNKGYSTDIYLKIKLPDGKEVLDEVSLKKDKNINLSNSGAGKFKEWDKNLPENVDQNKYREKQFKRNVAFLDKNKNSVLAFAKKNPKIQEILKTKGLSIDDAFKTGSNRAVAKLRYNIIAEMGKAGNKEAQKIYDSVNKEHEDFVKDSYEAITKNNKLKDGMLKDIRNEFPLKSIAEGEESMAIGDMSLDKSTLKQIFGTDDYNKIKDNLTVKTTKDGKSYLAYEALKGKDFIPIGDVIIYEDGKGYGGLFKFSLKLNNDFAKKIREAHSKVYSTNESNFKNYSTFLIENDI